MKHGVKILKRIFKNLRTIFWEKIFSKRLNILRFFVQFKFKNYTPMLHVRFLCEKSYPHVSIYKKRNTGVQFRLKKSRIPDFEKNATSPGTVDSKTIVSKQKSINTYVPYRTYVYQWQMTLRYGTLEYRYRTIQVR